MHFRDLQAGLGKLAGPIRRVFQYNVGNWIREMPMSKRIVTWAGVLLQGTAIYCLWSRSLAWPFQWPEDQGLVFLIALVAYGVGGVLMNAMLISEFARKTQLNPTRLRPARSS